MLLTCPSTYIGEFPYIGPWILGVSYLQAGAESLDLFVVSLWHSVVASWRSVLRERLLCGCPEVLGG